VSDRSVGVGPVCRRIVVRGVVQGVGFRPHVLRVAESVDVAGWCRNDATCVLIEVEGTLDRVTEFERRLESDAPPLARILSVETTKQPPVGHIGFRIAASASTAGARTMVPPDTAVCDDCLAELHDPANRRFRHPFITCTNCGPRFTITRDLPYDRAATTMADFLMCPACAEEYADPHDRRHHAQPIACHDCGPNLRVTGPSGAHIASGTEASLREAVAALRAGAIVAIKGIGGYHLACDAASQAATTALRTRKQRPDQPFAVMVRDLATARRFVEVGTAEAVLSSAARPIVLLPRVAGAGVAHGIAPGIDKLGVVLPYAPLHHLLFANLPDGSPGAPDALVMTSGNLSGEPLCFDDADALARLGRIAALFLSHDRAIAVPCDDSVIAGTTAMCSPSAGRGATRPSLSLWRGSRGWCSQPVPTSRTPSPWPATARRSSPPISATSRRSSPARRTSGPRPSFSASTSAHPTWSSLTSTRATLPAPGRVPWPTVSASPLHSVQHHHAHLASLAAEHGRLDEPLLGLVYDGTGYGCDAEVWGGELILLGDGGRTATRLGHLGTVRLPGGDAGVRNPVRTAALAMLVAGVELTGTPVDQALTASERRFIEACARTAPAGSRRAASAGSSMSSRHYSASAAERPMRRRRRSSSRLRPDAGARTRAPRQFRSLSPSRPSRASPSSIQTHWSRPSRTPFAPERRLATCLVLSRRPRLGQRRISRRPGTTARPRDRRPHRRGLWKPAAAPPAALGVGRRRPRGPHPSAGPRQRRRTIPWSGCDRRPRARGEWASTGSTDHGRVTRVGLPSQD